MPPIDYKIAQNQGYKELPVCKEEQRKEHLARLIKVLKSTQESIDEFKEYQENFNRLYKNPERIDEYFAYIDKQVGKKVIKLKEIPAIRDADDKQYSTSAMHLTDKQVTDLYNELQQRDIRDFKSNFNQYQRRVDLLQTFSTGVGALIKTVQSWPPNAPISELTKKIESELKKLNDNFETGHKGYKINESVISKHDSIELQSTGPQSFPGLCYEGLSDWDVHKDTVEKAKSARFMTAEDYDRDKIGYRYDDQQLWTKYHRDHRSELLSDSKTDYSKRRGSFIDYALSDIQSINQQLTASVAVR